MIHDLIVDLEGYTKKKKLGEGTYAYVYLVEEKKTGKQFAAKVSKLEFLKAEDQIIFFRELTAFSKVKNAATISLEGFNMANFNEEHFPTIIIPYMSNGSLDKLLESNPNFPSSTKYIILLGVAEGMKYLHSQGIIHRDLKPANILLDTDFHPYIGDFGESKISELTKSSILMKTFKGTPLFMAPEILSGDEYTYKVDVFAYSILMYILLTGKKPYVGYTSFFRLQNDIIDGKRPDLSCITNEHIKSFLSKCWSQNSEERPSFDEIVEELKGKEYRRLMNANDEEVSSYLSLFGDELNDTDEQSEKVADLKRKADNGDVKAMSKYANRLKRGDGVAKNEQEAARYFKMAAEKGNSDEMNNYAIMLKQGDGIPVDKVGAAHYYKMAIEKGSSSAMNNYAIMLKQGDGIPVDKVGAAHYYKMSIEKGSSSAMNNYANMLEQGDGIPVDKVGAARYYKMAIEKGNSSAMHNYAIMLKHGDGIPVDKVEAARYYKMAIEKGSTNAIHNYAIMLHQGDGIPVDKPEAARYYKMAAEKGNKKAMYNYAIMLEHGDGIPVDKVEAVRYYKMAIEKGNQRAKKRLERLQKGE